jgi:hypothetical protein
MRSITRIPALLLVAGLVIHGCGNGSTETDASEDTGTEMTDDVVEETGCDTAYPSGPYGILEGDTIDNLTFSRVGGGTVSLHDLFCDDSTTLLLLYATAGWCTVCQVESDDLPGVYADFHSEGLEILAAVFENTSGDPATVDYAEGYHDYYVFTFPTVADSDLLVTDYFDKTNAPMNMFVDLQTMEIIDIQTGYDAGGLRSDIETYLSP